MQKFQDNKNTELKPFIRGKIKVLLSKKGYRFSIDSVLLADFVKIGKGGKIIDLGTGNGIITLLLSLRHKNLKFYALEIQDSLYNLAIENFKLNDLKVDIKKGDVKQVKKLYNPNSFDYVVINPPYHKETGKKPKIEETKLAKFEILATVEDFIKAGKYLLKDKGKLFMINKADRLVETIKICVDNILYPSRFRFIHPSTEDKATHFLIECIKGKTSGGESINSPLILYKDKKNKIYTEEVQKILEEFEK